MRTFDCMKIEKEINQPKFKSNHEKAVVNVLYTGYWLKDRGEKVLKPFQLNEQHYNILRILKGRHPKTICPSEIKEVLLNKRGDLTRLLDKLVKMELVDRHHNDDNRRMINLEITDQGIALLEKLVPQIVDTNISSRKLTSDEAGQLSDLLDKLRG